MDFFAKADDARAASSTIGASAFADAIQQRSFQFNLTATPTRRPAAPPPPPLDGTKFIPFQPKDVISLLSSDTKPLIIDIRPYGHWSASRVRTSLSLSVPSTLLRRPNFSLDKLASMIPIPSAKVQFETWSSVSHIIIYDADTTVLGPGNNVLSILTKFLVADSKAKLGYLYGGFSGLEGAERNRLLDDSTHASLNEGQAASDQSQFLNARELPSGAFLQGKFKVEKRPPIQSQQLSASAGSTTSVARRVTPSQSRVIQTPHLARSGQQENKGDHFGDYQSVNGKQGPSTSRVAAANPFYDNIRQHLELATGITERIPLYLPKRVLKRKKELPYEWLRDIVRWGGGRSPITLANPMEGEGVALESGRLKPKPSSSGSVAASSGAGSTTNTERRIARLAAGEEGMESLAMVRFVYKTSQVHLTNGLPHLQQFYRIELGEQRRLMGVMEHHSKESAYPIRIDDDTSHPPTAAVKTPAPMSVSC